MFDADYVINKIHKMAGEDIEDGFYTHTDFDKYIPAVRAFIGDRKLKVMPGMQVLGEDESAIAFVWKQYPRYLIVDLHNDVCSYDSFDLRETKVKDAIVFDPDNPPKELIDLIPFIKD